MSRALQARISLSNLSHNFQQVKNRTSAKVMAVVKANGYGHGISRVALSLHQADYFGVASQDEAISLRAADVVKPIVVLEGFFEPNELDGILEHALLPVIHHSSQIDILESLRSSYQKKFSVWLKVDTGMNRVGFPVERANEAWQRLQECPSVGSVNCIMTHLACADDLNDSYTQTQLKAYRTVVNGKKVLRSVANSAGVISWPVSHEDIVRPGIMLYGATPMGVGIGADSDLRPVMTLSTQIISTKMLRRGDGIGYGQDWRAPEDMYVGVAAIGYGDGYPRHAPSGTPVLVNGARTGLIGRVSMDMICVDLRGLETAKVGDEVILWGQGLPVEHVAVHAKTISYDLLCGLTQRVDIVDDET